MTLITRLKLNILYSLFKLNLFIIKINKYFIYPPVNHTDNFERFNRKSVNFINYSRQLMNSLIDDNLELMKQTSRLERKLYNVVKLLDEKSIKPSSEKTIIQYITLANIFFTMLFINVFFKVLTNILFI